MDIMALPLDLHEKIMDTVEPHRVAMRRRLVERERSAQLERVQDELGIYFYYGALYLWTWFPQPTHVTVYEAVSNTEDQRRWLIDCVAGNCDLKHVYTYNSFPRVGHLAEWVSRMAKVHSMVRAYVPRYPAWVPVIVHHVP